MYSFLILFLFLAEKSKQEQEGIFSSHEPIMIVEIYREGATTPKIGNALNMEYVKKLGSKSVTEIGMRQHYNLGIQVKSDYKELINSINSPSEVKVFSSSRRSSILSAISHNLGMFKKDNEVEIEKVLKESKPLWIDFQQNKGEYSDFETQNINIPLIIAEKTNDKMFLSRLKRICPKAAKKRFDTINNLNKVYSPLFGDYYKEFSHYGIKPSYFDNNKDAKSFFEVITTALKKTQRKKSLLKNKNSLKSKEKTIERWDLKKIFFWYDTIASYIYYFGYDPRQMRDEVVERFNLLQSSFLFGMFNSDDFIKLYTTKIAEEIYREFSTRANKRNEENRFDKLKYLAFSSNEMTLAGMITGLGMSDSLCNLEKVYQNFTERKCKNSPDYASNILFELSRKEGELYVRTFYNRKRVNFCTGREEYCPLNDFLEILDERMITERFAEICGNEESIIMPNSHYFVIIFLLLILLCFFRNKVIEMESLMNKKERNSNDPFG